MTRGGLAAFLAAVGVVAFACRPIPAPTDGVLALSDVQLPSPAVVAGDTMRDSLGVAAPLGVIAFGVGGDADTITNVTPTFLMLDSGATVDSNGYMVGGAVSSSPVRVVGTVGTLQTAAANVYVIPLPDSLAASGATTTKPDTFKVTDPNSYYTPTVTAKVLSAGTGVRSVIVKWRIVSMPPSSDTAATGALVSTAKRPATRDTTDVSGNASIGIHMNLVAIDSLAAPDSFVVEASASYKGVPLHGSPLRFVLPVVKGQ